jgi:hypothetical protein
MGVPLLYRLYYDRVINALLVAGVVWLLWKLIDAAFERVRDAGVFGAPSVIPRETVGAPAGRAPSGLDGCRRLR